MINLSIVIPHYNSSQKVEKLLSTIPFRDDVQVIIVDDRSNSDECMKLLTIKESYSFELYKNEGVKGAGACRNIGLEKVLGRWVLFADSDDYFYDNFYQKVSSYFYENIDVVFFRPTSIYLDTNELANRHLSITERLDKYSKLSDEKSELELKYKIAPPWAKLINMKLITEYNIRFDEVIASNDVMFSTKVGYYLKEFIVSNEILYVVTRSHGSLTVTLSEEVHKSRLDAFISQYIFLKKNLDKIDFKLIEISGFGVIVKTFYDYGFLCGLKCGLTLVKNGVPIFNRNHLNPIFLHTKVKKFLSWVFVDKKYKSKS